MRYGVWGAIVMVICMALPLRAQSNLKWVIEWADTVDWGTTEYANAITKDSKGNIYVVGEANLTGSYDVFIIKYDPEGNIVWADTFDYLGQSDNAKRVIVDRYGNIFITGYTNNGTDDDFLTIAYDSSGNFMWANVFDNGDDDEAYGIVKGSGNVVYVVGRSYFDSDNHMVLVTYDGDYGTQLGVDTICDGIPKDMKIFRTLLYEYLYIAGNEYIGTNDDILLLKYNPETGNIVWMDTLDLLDIERAEGIVLRASFLTGVNAIYVVGESYDSGEWAYLTLKFDPSGNLVWYRRFQIGDTTSMGKAISADVGGNIYVTGWGWDSTMDWGNVIYDSSGNLIWVDTLGINDGYDRGYGIVAVDTNTFYVTGWGHSDVNFYDILTVKYTKYKDAGIVSVVEPTDTVYTDSLYTPEIKVTNNSYNLLLDFDIIAFVDSLGTIVYTDTQSVVDMAPGDTQLITFDFWKAPSTSCELTFGFYLSGIEDFNTSNDTVSKTVYVVPLTGVSEGTVSGGMFLRVEGVSRGKIVFSYNVTGNTPYEVIIYSVDGKVVKRIEGRKAGYHREVIGGLPSGIYYIKLRQGEKAITRKAILISE